MLISEERDHGSKHTKPAQLVRKIGQSDVLVLSVSFSPVKAELLHDIKDIGDDRMMNPVSTLFMVVQAFKKNVTKEVAHMSGGEYNTFTGRQGLRGAGGGVGQARPQPVSDHLQPFGPHAGPAYDSRAPGAGLRRTRCRAGELLEGAGTVEAASRRPH